MKYLILIIKGIAIGAANVIPGVSGGTIALITGVFERLINSIKSFGPRAVKLLLKGRFKEFAVHTDFFFLLSIFIGVLLAIVTLARLFDYLFTNYPVYIWAYFFGLVLASVYFVGKTVDKWSISAIITFILGTAIAIMISVLNPAGENRSFIYLVICGVAAICSMILPGLSGSFILFIMGNYKLVAIEAINNRDTDVLIPVFIGAAGGLIAFSHLLSWVLKKFRDQTISLLTGFILGSVSILWPWQKAVHLADEFGNLITKEGEAVVVRYERFIPQSFSTEIIIAIAVILFGIISLWAVEKAATRNQD